MGFAECPSKNIKVRNCPESILQKMVFLPNSEDFVTEGIKRNQKKHLEQLCDVELISDGFKIPCHKLLLALHSEYFRKFFACSINSFQEESKKIEIMSIGPSTLYSIKTFLYTGEVNLTRKTLRKFLEAFTFFMIYDGYGKLENAMRRIDDDIKLVKLDDNEQILLVDYCVFNCLYRCLKRYIIFERWKLWDEMKYTL